MKYLSIIFCFLPGWISAQQIADSSASLADDTYVFRSVVLGNDTVPVVNLKSTEVTYKRKRLTRKERKFLRLRRHVTKVYPYAKLAGELFEAYENELDSLNSELERKQFMKQAEEELRKEFEGELKNLTFTQGKILIKLVDRETGNTSYEVVKHFRGGLSAFFWQSMARLFGANLKSNYDADGDDAEIESVVREIEAGRILVKERKANTLAAQQQIKRAKKNKKRKKKNKK